MGNYNIYVGVPTYEVQYAGTVRNVTRDEAFRYAEELAYEEYESNAGLHGIPSYSEIYEELVEYYHEELETGEYNEVDIESFADEQYEEERESWTNYYIREESKDKEFYECYSESKKFYLN